MFKICTQLVRFLMLGHTSHCCISIRQYTFPKWRPTKILVHKNCTDDHMIQCKITLKASWKTIRVHLSYPINIRNMACQNEKPILWQHFVFSWTTHEPDHACYQYISHSVLRHRKGQLCLPRPLRLCFSPWRDPAALSCKHCCCFHRTWDCRW